MNQDMGITIYTSGDRSVGINGAIYHVIVEGGASQFEDMDYRNDARKILAEAIGQLEDMPVSDVVFDDECGDCLKRECICKDSTEDIIYQAEYAYACGYQD